MHPSTFRSRHGWAFFKAFDRIHDISKYIKIHKELIKMDHISCADVRRPIPWNMQAIDIDRVAQKEV
jgi:hypothetical protein